MNQLKDRFAEDSLLQLLRVEAEGLAGEPSLAEVEGLSIQQIQTLLHDLWVHQIELEMQNEELRKTQAVLAASRDKFSQLYDAAPVGYCSLNENGIILECNHTLSSLLGLSRAKLLHYPLGHFIDSQDLSILHHMLHSDQSSMEHAIRFASGGQAKANTSAKTAPLHILLHLQRISQAADSGEAVWLAACSDISQLQELSLELKVKGRALESTLEGVMITNQQMQICYVNPAFEQTTGYGKEQALGQTPSLLKSGKHTATFYRDMWSQLLRDGSWRGEIWNRRANGEIYPEWLSISTIFDEQRRPQYFVGVFSDISREESTRRRLHQLAYFDGITGLPNRHLFLDRLNQELAHARRNHSGFALLFMDLDRFKSINDTLGHSVGDELLLQVSQRLACALRENDTVARMGGDEFLMLLPGVDSQEDAEQVAQKILLLMAQPYDLEGRQYHVSISVGLSRFPEDGLDADSLIKHADIAMYQSKDSGRNTYSSFTLDLNKQVSERVLLEHDLREALRHERLELHYQPQWHLASGGWHGVEALLRWNHPRQGMIAPDLFIPLAEESGLIVQIGAWVLRRAAQQYLEWRQKGVDVGLISINLSPHQFMQSNLVDVIGDILNECGMPADKLAVEITEHAAMPNFKYSAKTLEALRGMGIGIHIDDFGTGFSSLSHLRHLPIDVLKIDRQFIDEIPNNQDDLAIVQSILAMAKALKISVVAEGVETAEQRDFLIQQGCDIGQGYLFSRPLPSWEIDLLLARAQEAETHKAQMTPVITD
jgi:diguanylate cyclase (GGDEF)-like protein/PAS domain S-box-containing protein